MTIPTERSALGFVLLSLVLSCARAPGAFDESADSMSFDDEVDASTVTVQREPTRDAGLSQRDATAVVFVDGFEIDERSPTTSAEAALPGTAAQHAGATSPAVVVQVDAGTPAAETAANEPGAPRSATAPTAPEEPARTDDRATGAGDASVALAPAATTDAGKPGPTPMPAAAIDAGTTKPVSLPAAPGVAQRCKPGRYQGAFKGQIVQADVGSLMLDGTITLELALSADGKTMDVSSSSVEATDVVGTPIHAEVDGNVDCNSLQLGSGTLQGRYGREGDATTIGFQGTVSGTYDDEPTSLRGTWSVGSSASGTFDASRVD